jgi:muconolactone delta-isomerase
MGGTLTNNFQLSVVSASTTTVLTTDRWRYNSSMQFLSLSRRRVDAFPPEAFTPELVAREGNRVRELYATGILRQVWRRGDMPGAAILWEAASEAEVRAALDSLPIAQAGMLEIQALVPLAPYPGFGPA